MINAKVKLNINFPEFTFSRDLKEIANKIIIPDMQDRIEHRSVDISNKKYAPLSPKTIAAKRKKGHRLEPLIATGLLRRSMITRTSGRTSVKILIRGDRKDVAEALQLKGIRSKRFGRRFFEFFGISDKAEGLAINFMINKINQAINRGGRKSVQ